MSNSALMYSDTLLAVSGYNAMLLMLVVVITVVFGMLVGSYLLGPGRKGKIKSIAYESGLDPIDNARKPFHARFYMLAIMFLVFDVELIFFYPWAVVYNGSQSLVYLIAIIIFTVFLLVALLYDIASGVFDWK